MFELGVLQPLGDRGDSLQMLSNRERERERERESFYRRLEI